MSAEEAKQEIEGLKRRLSFAQGRFARLIEILDSTLGQETLQDIIEGLGRYCSGTIGLAQEHEGDVEGYFEQIRQRGGEEAEFDRGRGVITVVTPERECVCPLVDSQSTPASICNCSLGWQKQTYETILGRPVEVEIKESALRGSKRCVFEIRVS